MTKENPKLADRVKYKKYRIKNQVRRFRIRAGLSQKELAKHLKVSGDVVISNWERGIKKPHPKNLKHMSEVLYVDPEILYPPQEIDDMGEPISAL